MLIKIATRFGVHPEYSAGGAERQMELIGRHMLKKNVDFYYITNKINKDQKDFEIINGINVLNININKQWKFPIRKIKEKIFKFIASYDIPLFFKYFHEFNFDIYHFRAANKLTGVWAFFAQIIKKKKFVYTISHVNQCKKKRNPSHKFQYKLFQYGLKKAAIVIALTDYMKKELYKNYGIKSVVIKSGHPIPKGPFKKMKPPIILWIASLKDWKRPNLFLKIANDLKNLDVEFLLIGDGSREYMKEEINNFSNKHKNLSFIPGVPTGKDNDYYKKASLIVNTSINEGFPNAFIQAWLHETPVMSLDVDPDCVICKNGLGYHAKGNLNSLINMIKELIKDPIKLKEMGKNCRNYAIQNHNIEKTANQHYKIYKWLLTKT